MSLSKIAFFAFGLAAVLVTGLQHADAARRNAVHGYSSYSSIDAAEEALFQRTKGNRADDL